jgi:type I restriction enzyme, S subunit
VLRQGEFPYYGASGIIDTIDDYLFDGDFLLIGEDGANLISRSTPIAFLASGRFWVNNHAHILQARTETSNNWLGGYINMIDLVPFVTGTAQPKLTQTALNRLGVPLPSIQEQQEILRHIGTAFGWIDRLAANATSARKLIDHLDQAILAKAFRGELVPQDPNDEPASVFLQRIRAERAKASAMPSKTTHPRRRKQ